MSGKIISGLVIAFVSAILCGCTRNNGDIGWLFGEWRLDRMTADGAEVDLYPGGEDEAILYTWSFQSDIIRINTMLPNHRRDEVFGSWEEKDDILELNFSYRYDDGLFMPPPALHLVRGGITPLHIDSRGGKKAVFSYTADDGVSYTYYLSHPH